jgi:hypothetical protein
MGCISKPQSKDNKSETECSLDDLRNCFAVVPKVELEVLTCSLLHVLRCIHVDGPADVADAADVAGTADVAALLVPSSRPPVKEVPAKS